MTVLINTRTPFNKVDRVFFNNLRTWVLQKHTFLSAAIFEYDPCYCICKIHSAAEIGVNEFLSYSKLIIAYAYNIYTSFSTASISFIGRKGVYPPMNDVSFFTEQWYGKTLMTSEITSTRFYTNVVICKIDGTACLQFKMSLLKT